MTGYVARRNPNRRPTSPAQVLVNTVLPALGRSKSEVADALGVSRQAFYDILSGKSAVTPAMALRLGKMCGNGPQVWIKMQAACDLWDAEQKVDLSKIPKLEPAA